MKNVIRFAVAGALMAGYATAQAQALPSSGSADLWLFVSDQTAQTTFAEDTGESLSSLLSTTVASAKLSTVNSDNFTVAESSALAAYIAAANTAGHTLEWAVSGVQYQGTTGNSVNTTPGQMIGVFDALSTASSKVVPRLRPTGTAPRLGKKVND